MDTLDFNKRKLENVNEVERLTDEYNSLDFLIRDVSFIARLSPYISKNSHIADFGTGGGTIPLMLINLNPNVVITGYDSSLAMLQTAKNRQKINKTSNNPHWIKADLNKPVKFALKYDFIYSHATVHHIANLSMFFQNIKNGLKKKGSFFIRDLIRPKNHQEAVKIVNMYSSKYCTHEQKLLFYNSLHSSFRINEMKNILKKHLISCKVLRARDIPIYWEMYGQF